MQVADPRSLNFVPELGTDDFTLEFDVQSVMTAIGVNYGVIDFEELQEVPYTRDEVEIDGVSQVYAEYYNSRYPNMNTITCFAHKNIFAEDYEWDRIDTCAIEIGITPLYPVLNHIGYTPPAEAAEGGPGGSAETLYCSCSEEIMSSSDLSEQCESFLLMTGVYLKLCFLLFLLLIV